MFNANGLAGLKLKVPAGSLFWSVEAIADSEIRKILWSTEYLQVGLEYCGVGTAVLTTTRVPGTGELVKKRVVHPSGSDIVVVFWYEVNEGKITLLVPLKGIKYLKNTPHQIILKVLYNRYHNCVISWIILLHSNESHCITLLLIECKVLF